jgi:mannitol 2-dehydrogenase
VGNFHRAHQAVYLDELARRGISSAWGITGVSLRRRDVPAALRPQDCVYSVVERGAGRDRVRIVGSLRRCLFAPADPAGVVAALASPRTRLVTITVTEAGYHLDREGALDLDDPAVRADLSLLRPPRTAPGFLVAALARRRARGMPPFTVLSCDNLPDNGAAAQAAVVGLADARDETLGRWIEHNVAFPGSMVDRITPDICPAERERLAHATGVPDAWPVITEPFSQWVVEDRFACARPPFEEVGVDVVGDVARHRLAKTRLLNASHSALGYLGWLAGHRRTDEAMADPVLRRYIDALMGREIAPLLPTPPGMALGDYRRTLIERLTNPRIGDRLERLCARGSAKMPAYVLPSLADAVCAGRPHELLTLAVAAWMRYLRGTDLEGRPIEVRDARAAALRRRARAGGEDPRPLLADRDAFGGLPLGSSLEAVLQRALRDLDRLGVHGAIVLRCPGA